MCVGYVESGGGAGACLGGGLCGVAFGPLFGYPVVLGSVGQVLGGDASHQGVRCKRQEHVSIS